MRENNQDNNNDSIKSNNTVESTPTLKTPAPKPLMVAITYSKDELKTSAPQPNTSTIKNTPKEKPQQK